MVDIYFKDGSCHHFEDNISGSCLAQSISSSLGKQAVLCKINGEVRDLNTCIPDQANVEILTLTSVETLTTLRHSTAHLLAKAVKELFPKAKLAVGPATEEGFFYDFQTQPFSPEDLKAIEKRMHELVRQNIPFQRQEMSREEAIALFEKNDEHFKVELLKEMTSDTVSVYRLQNDQGILDDLCRGPHVPSTKWLGTAFKIIKSSGSYWKGDKDKAALQRVYGTAFPTKDAMNIYFTKLAEAEKRDHRKLGIALDLFHIQDLAPGAIFWHTKGWTLYRLLRQFVRQRMERDGYQEVNTPMIVDRILWEKSGHWDKYRENMFITETADEKTMAIKPMNCPCHVQIFNQKIVSYKDLPWRIAEFGSCHRYEPSGALHGLMRVRGFVQDDAHIFCRPDQIVSETQRFCHLLDNIYKTLGFKDYFVKFSDRPAKRAGSDEVWDQAEKALRDAANSAGLDYIVSPGEGAFYGPKLEFVLKDCLGRDWQCGTLQVDFVLPQRLDAHYIDQNGTKQTPVMLHRAVLGSMERFIGILIEQYAGAFPVWLAPIQVVIATVTQEAVPYAQNLYNLMQGKGIRCEIDIKNEKISYKVRQHSEQKIPYIAVVGKKEQEDHKIALRTLGSDQNRDISPEELIQMILNSVPV